MCKLTNEVFWGDIVMCDFGASYGCEQGGRRPALVVQNDVGNKYSPTVIVCPITTKSKKSLPTHIVVTPQETGLREISTILFEQVRSVDKTRIKLQDGKIIKVGQVGSELKENIQKVLTLNFQMMYNNNT